MAQGILITIFGTIGVLTKHDHWCKEAEDVEPIVGPLCRMIEALPAKTLKAVEKRFNGVALGLGCAFVVVPDVAQEIRLRADASKEKKAGQGTGAAPGSVPPFGQAQSRTSWIRGDHPGADEGNGRGDAGSAPWGDTLPPESLQVDY